jgi:hypothetical protein
MHRLLLVGAFAAVVCACQPGAPSESPAPAPTEETVTGWLAADGAGETGIVYRDSADEPGFAMSCRQASKTFHLSASDPVETPPVAKETATLILGDETFVVPVTAGAADASGARALTVETPVVPQLLRAIADAKSARLVFRDAFVETGVDTEGKLLAFSQQCETLTGVSAAP